MSRRAYRLPARLYPIVDTAAVRQQPVDFARRLLDGGVPLLQLRGKNVPSGELLDLARQLRAEAAQRGARLIVNDRADVARLAGAAGVHLGQHDLPPPAARSILGPEAVIGLSTHNREQVLAAGTLTSIDYIGFGPIFPTSTKADADPCQGLTGLREVRGCTDLPIVAIGGVTMENAGSVLEAGADAVAMIGSLLADPESVLRALL